MSFLAEGFEIVDVPNPGRGHDIAEEAATLILQELFDICAPNDVQIQAAIETEMDGHLFVAAFGAERTVLATGGILLIERPDQPGRALVSSVVVSPAERGRGLGVAVMESLEDKAAELGASETFGLARPESMSFYEKLGYKKHRNPRIMDDILAKSL